MNSQDKNSVAMMWVGLAIILVLMAVAYLVGRQQKKCEVSDCSDSVETVRKLRVEVEELTDEKNILQTQLNAVKNTYACRTDLTEDGKQTLINELLSLITGLYSCNKTTTK